MVGSAGSGDAAGGLRELQSRRTSVEVPWASRLLAPAHGLLSLTAFPCEHAIGLQIAIGTGSCEFAGSCCETGVGSQVPEKSQAIL